MRVWLLLLPLAFWAMGKAKAEVVFSKEGPIVMPASTGYIVFEIRSQDLEDMFMAKANTLHHSFKKFITTQMLAQPCSSNTSSCIHEEWLHLEKEIGFITGQINQTVGAIIKLVTTDEQGREKRSILSVFNFATNMVSIGFSFKNMADISELRDIVNSIRKEQNSLISVVEDISKTQLKDHAAIVRLLEYQKR